VKPALVLALLLVASSAHANALDMFGFGARAGGMGGAQTAAVDDAGANYANPAALAARDTIELDFGVQTARPDLRMNGKSQEVDASLGWTLGLVVPGKLLGKRFGFGVATFVPEPHITRTRALPAQLPRWVLYDNRPQRLFLGFNVAFALGERVLIGGGVAFLARLTGDLTLRGRIGFPDADDSELALDIDVDLRSIRYPQAGVLVHVTPWLDVGVTYRGGFTLKIDEVLAIEGDVGQAGAPPIIDDGFLRLHAVSLDHFQPTSVAVGFAARLSRRVLVAGDVVWQRWSAFRNPAADIALALDLKDLNDLVDIPDALALPGAFFHDIVIPRLGLEVGALRGRHAALDVRAGWAYEPSPAPEQQGETNFMDADKHSMTLGLGLTLAGLTELLPRPVHLDVSLGLTLVQARTHRKLMADDPVGDVAGKGHVWQLALSTRWEL
jgi:long-subunit fatty acid transport protein